jgi:hypothetical protein
VLDIYRSLRNIYRSLDPIEKALVWTPVALFILTLAPRVSSAGLVAGAQVAAALGTFALAVLAFYQVREMRESRLAQDRLGDARALERLHHAGRLQPRDTRIRRSSCQRDGGCSGEWSRRWQRR